MFATAVNDLFNFCCCDGRGGGGGGGEIRGVVEAFVRARLSASVLEKQPSLKSNANSCVEA